MNVVVTGSRHADPSPTGRDRELIAATLAWLAPRQGSLFGDGPPQPTGPPITTPAPDVTVFHGGAKGVDSIVGSVCLEMGVSVVAIPVDHSVDGPWPSAGPRRNQRMVRLARPELLIAFPMFGKPNRGTLDCWKRAIRVARSGQLVWLGWRPE